MLMSSLIALSCCAVLGLALYVRLARNRAGSLWLILRGIVSAPIRLWSRPPGRHRPQADAATEPQLSSNQTVLPGEASS
jgi:hypothetical protein